VPLDGAGSDRGKRKGAGLERASLKSERNPVHSGREVGVEAMEGVLVRVMSSF
jgi:hypothetical protein